MAERIASQILAFRGLNTESYTGLQLFKFNDGSYLAITNELPQNIGTSVPNHVEIVAKTIADRFQIPPERLRLIDHSPPGSALGFSETFHEAPLVWNNKEFVLSHGGAWESLRRDKVEKLIGQEYKIGL